MNNPESPITLKLNTVLIDNFRSSDTIQLYRDQLDIDVSRFFVGQTEFYLYKCRDTGYRFYYPARLDGDGKFYEQLQQRLGTGYYHAGKFENQFALEEIKADERILDGGGGEGEFI